MMVYSYNPSTQETEAKGLREFKASLEDWQDLVSKKKKKIKQAGHWWFTPVTVATWEAESKED
jgi:hypothetical protein